jgi:hypothetical protein
MPGKIGKLPCRPLVPSLPTIPAARRATLNRRERPAFCCPGTMPLSTRDTNIVLSARSDEMRDFRGIAQVEAVHAFLDQAIGVCDPLVLAQMLCP